VLGTCTIVLLLSCSTEHVNRVESPCRAHHHCTICVLPPYIRIPGTALLADLTAHQVFVYLQHNSPQLCFKPITECASPELSLYTTPRLILTLHAQTHAVRSFFFMNCRCVRRWTEREPNVSNVFKHVWSSVRKNRCTELNVRYSGPTPRLTTNNPSFRLKHVENKRCKGVEI
jgi:hypothetical protein